MQKVIIFALLAALTALCGVAFAQPAARDGTNAPAINAPAIIVAQADFAGSAIVAKIDPTEAGPAMASVSNKIIDLQHRPNGDGTIVAITEKEVGPLRNEKGFVAGNASLTKIIPDINSATDKSVVRQLSDFKLLASSQSTFGLITAAAG